MPQKAVQRRRVWARLQRSGPGRRTSGAARAATAGGSGRWMWSAWTSASANSGATRFAARSLLLLPLPELRAPSGRRSCSRTQKATQRPPQAGTAMRSGVGASPGRYTAAPAFQGAMPAVVSRCSAATAAPTLRLRGFDREAHPAIAAAATARDVPSSRATAPLQPHFSPSLSVARSIC
jgi:hypothetical protein